MGMSDRKRYEEMAKAQRGIPDARVTGYVKGRGGVNPGVATLGVLGANVVVFGGLLWLTGGLVFLGVIGVLMVIEAISPTRIVIVTDRGIALANPSMWSSRPPKIVATMGHGYVQPAERLLRSMKVMVGREHIWLPWKEEEALRAAIFQHPLTQQVPVPYR
jgi:hypothetical protein